MESMDDRKFDKTLKEKFVSFEANAPMDLWRNIEEELDAVKPNEPTVVEKNASILIPGKINENKETGKLKRLVMLLGSIAAMLLIAFVFLRNDNSEVIYLKPNAKKQHVETSAAKKESISENTFPLAQELPDTKNNFVSVTEIVVKEQRSEKLQFAQKAQPSIGVVENNGEPQVLNEEVINQAVALVPIDIAIEQKEPLSIPANSPVLALQEISIQQEWLGNSSEGNARESNNKKIGLSTVLNFLTKGLNSERENPIEFSETEDGILRLDIKSSFAKNPR